MKDLFGAGELSANTVELAKIVYPDLAQPGVKKVGIALEMTIDFLTIPIKYLGMIGKKYDINIQKSLQDYRIKMDHQPIKNIGTVTPEIGVPIIEDLTRVTNGELASLYVDLLVNASTINKSEYVHPSFINVLRSLSFDEAKIIKILSAGFTSFSFINYRRVDENGSIVPLDTFNNVSDIVELTFPENSEFYMINLVKLGILERTETYLAPEQRNYKKLMEKHKHVYDDFKRSLQSLDDTDPIKKSKVDILQGRYRITKYGEQFIQSITLD
ncbi:DUF4393 domain-containing protein [Jeotgalibacillus sp. S-D1]|uniref:DUF4393 domain-containing protein n=1 Tax=Jeotgalibacillus sp. S-D1 TaxID=2552189 RepID=UPI00105A24E1|nr:DUF4393 domain-containing protein [Jeotgalibacillus sp. S-D1]TDL34582.1 DUF4393 domain-containing protein [Jeotgalibacillus sp. S-D1]